MKTLILFLALVASAGAVPFTQVHDFRDGNRWTPIGPDAGLQSVSIEIHSIGSARDYEFNPFAGPYNYTPRLIVTLCTDLFLGSQLQFRDQEGQWMFTGSPVVIAPGGSNSWSTGWDLTAFGDFDVSDGTAESFMQQGFLLGLVERVDGGNHYGDLWPVPLNALLEMTLTYDYGDFTPFARLGPQVAQTPDSGGTLALAGAGIISLLGLRKFLLA